MASKTVQIESPTQFSNLLATSTIVIADFYADWCGPCKQIAPVYEQLSAQLSRPNKITFTKINTDRQQELAQAYGVTAMPTFMIFKNGRRTESIQGANMPALSSAIKKVADEANKVDSSAGESSSGKYWLGATLPKNYSDVTDQVDVRGLELLNFDGDKGGPRTLFKETKPKGWSSLHIDAPITNNNEVDDEKDYVESDTDEQLMIYVPFQSMLKVHTLHITSATVNASEDDEKPSRPTSIKIFTNKPQILSFDDAENNTATQNVSLSETDWNSSTNTAKVELRFVKFQNVTSLVIFVAESEGDNDKVRIDRIRIIGESGEKRDGKIEKISHED